MKSFVKVQTVIGLLVQRHPDLSDMFVHFCNICAFAMKNDTLLAELPRVILDLRGQSVLCSYLSDQETELLEEVLIDMTLDISMYLAEKRNR